MPNASVSQPQQVLMHEQPKQAVQPENAKQYLTFHLA